MTIASKVKAYKEANPNASQKEIAKACGTAPAYVSTILNSKKTAKEVAPVEKFSQKDYDKLHEKFKVLLTVAEAMQKQIDDSQAVIRYLEDKIENGCC